MQKWLLPTHARLFLVSAIFMVLLVPISIPKLLLEAYGEISHDIIVADRDASSLFLVDSTTGDRSILHTFVDFFPHDVKFDSDGNLWVLEPNPVMQGFREQASILSRMDPDTGELVTVWQGPGNAQTGAQTETIRMAFEANGDVILAGGGGILWRIDAVTGTGSTVTDELVAAAVAIEDDGDILVLGGDGTIVGVFSVDPATGEHALVSAVSTSNLWDIAVASDGTIIVLAQQSILKIDPNTGDQSLFFVDPNPASFLGMEVGEDDDIYVLKQVPVHTGELLKIDYLTAAVIVLSNGPPFDEAFDLTFVPPGITLKATIADATTRATGQSMYAGGRTFYGEKFGSGAAIISEEADCAMVELRKHGSATGLAEIGFFDAQMNLVKQFGTIDVSKLATSYKQYEFCLPSTVPNHLIEENQILAVKYNGGDPVNRIDVRRSNVANWPYYDGLSAYHVNFDTSWHIYSIEGNNRDLLFKLTNTP